MNGDGSDVRYGGTLEFLCEDANTHEVKRVTLDLGIVTSVKSTLSKSINTSIKVPSKGPRYCYAYDTGTTRSVDVEFTRVSPCLSGARNGVSGADAVFGADESPVDANSPVRLPSEDSDSRLFSNAYWIRLMELAVDRWQMRFDGCEFTYVPYTGVTEDTFVSEGGEVLVEYPVRGDPYGEDGVRQDTLGRYVCRPRGVTHHGMVSSLTLTVSSSKGTPNVVSGSFKLQVGRRLHPPVELNVNGGE